VNSCGPCDPVCSKVNDAPVPKGDSMEINLQDDSKVDKNEIDVNF